MIPLLPVAVGCWGELRWLSEDDLWCWWLTQPPMSSVDEKLRPSEEDVARFLSSAISPDAMPSPQTPLLSIWSGHQMIDANKMWLFFFVIFSLATETKASKIHKTFLLYCAITAFLIRTIWPSVPCHKISVRRTFAYLINNINLNLNLISVWLLVPLCSWNSYSFLGYAANLIGSSSKLSSEDGAEISFPVLQPIKDFESSDLWSREGVY